MRKSFAILGLVSITVASSALAQQTGGAPAGAGPLDPTNAVRSQNYGAPGSLNDPVAAYEQQRSLENLPGQKAAEAKYGRARPAKPSEITLGATVNDNTGVPVATIAEVDPDGVVISMAASKVKVPTDALGHNNAGLLVDMSKAQFEKLVAQANPLTDLWLTLQGGARSFRGASRCLCHSKGLEVGRNGS